MDRLFVYGIFLGENMRKAYEMTNPEYATVRDYVTFGNQIVTAKHLPGCNLSLTGLTVDIPKKQWKRLDRLEGGYERKLVRTTDNEEVYMYTGKEIR
jgi:gamma-glutamylcyclotransferase (GGCT)/AIG2-like uncharacterized protein YtfP